MERTWDCIVVGGGAAGLSAALVLGRARRRTLVVDAGEQSNRVAHGIGGLLGHDGRPPADLYAQGRRELAAYPSVEVLDGRVTDGRRDGGDDGDPFVLTVSVAGDERIERTRTVLLATGMDYRPRADLPGLRALWGDTVFHCPFCHGWEVQGEPLAVLAGGDDGVHMALMLQAWSDDVVLLAGDVPPAGRERLEAAGVTVETRSVTALRADAGKLAGIVLADGTELERRGLLVATTLHQRTDLGARLGAETAPPGPQVIDALLLDPMQATTAPGVWAAGDTTGQPPSVAGAIASGMMAAAMLVRTMQGV